MSVWAFDVDGCIVDSLTGGSLRPGTLAVLEHLRECGHTIVLWSAGGDDYARKRATQHGIAHLVDEAYGKENRDTDGRWSLDCFEPHHRPAVLVDDRPEDAPHALEVIAVRPYIAHDPDDRGLLHLLPPLPDIATAMEAS